MSRTLQVVAIVERPAPDFCGAASATATLAVVRCNGCQQPIATVVRPWETAGDVVDAMLRAARWVVSAPARDECPDCAADREQIDAMRCPVCRSPYEHRDGCSRRGGAR